MTFTLSFDAMLREVYARSAMAHISNPGAERPAPLQPDHAPALRELMRESFAALCRALGSMVADTNLDTADVSADPFLSLDVSLPPGTEASVFRATMEHAVAAGALASAWGRPELSAEAADWTRRLRMLAAVSGRRRVEPCCY